MNEENCPVKGKKCTFLAAIVVVASGLIAWSLISLYTSAPLIEETAAEEEIEESAPETLPTAEESKSGVKALPPPAQEKPQETKTKTE